jgi:hypothetical protein
MSMMISRSTLLRPLAFCGLAAALVVAPSLTRAQSTTPDTLAADLDTDIPLSSKILPNPAPEAEEGEGLILQADALVASHYMAQGIDSSFDHRVTQSSLTAARGALSATVWNNFDMGDRGVNEVDVTCGYTQEVANLALTVGYQHMGYPNRPGTPAGNEVTFNAALEAPLSPALNVHYDFDAGDGLYLTGAVTQALPRHFALTGQVFYQNHYFQLSGLTAGALTVGYTTGLGNLSVKPAVTWYRGVPNGDFRGEAAVPSRWVLGLGFSTRL